MELLGLMTRSPFRAHCEAEEVGKTVWFALRWKNSRGEAGPWSRVFSAVVPG